MPYVPKEDSLNPKNALSKQLETALSKAGTLADFTDIKKVNALFEKNKWSLEKKVKILVEMTKLYKTKPTVARAAMAMLDKTYEDAIARSDLAPKPTNVPKPEFGAHGSAIGMPSSENVQSIEMTTKTMQVNFKELSNGKKAKKLQTTDKANGAGDDSGDPNIIDSDIIEPDGDTEAWSGDAPGGTGDSFSDGPDAGPDTAGDTAGDPDPDQAAYFQDDRDAGTLHRAPSSGYGVRSESI